MEKNLKEFLDNQDSVRSNLTNFIIKKQMSVNKASADIGVSYVTLSAFLKKNKKIELIPLSKIVNFIEKNK